MPIPGRMLPHQISILTPTMVADGYGNTVPDWATPATRAAAAYVRPLGSSTGGPSSGDEYVTPGRDVSDRSLQAHTNDLAVTVFERVVYAGVTYEIDGPPSVWLSAPGGRMSHSKMRLRRVDG